MRTVAPRRTSPAWLLPALLILPLSTGAAVAALILANLSLPATAAVLIAAGVVGWRAAMRRLCDDERRRLTRRAARGARAGVLATAGYDLSRYGLVSLTQMTFWPFHAIALFGQMFVGPKAPEPMQYAVGWSYHLGTGIGFAVAYALAFRRARLSTAVAWAGLLELWIAVLYPSWLRITALQEFLAVSIVGHAVYGVLLGSYLRATDRVDV